MRSEGLEPSRLSALASKTSVSANSTTSASEGPYFNQVVCFTTLNTKQHFGSVKVRTFPSVTKDSLRGPSVCPFLDIHPVVLPLVGNRPNTIKYYCAGNNGIEPSSFRMDKFSRLVVHHTLYFPFYLAGGNRIELSTISGWAGFQDRVRAMQPTP